jgi:hypothetical protein
VIAVTPGHLITVDRGRPVATPQPASIAGGAAAVAALGLRVALAAMAVLRLAATIPLTKRSTPDRS